MSRPPLSAIRHAYDSLGRAASAAAEAYGPYPCSDGCAWCCHSPVVVNDADMRLLKDAMERMPPADRQEVLVCAASYVAALESAGLDLHTKGGYDRIARLNAGALLPVMEKYWPDGGIPCPLLRLEMTGECPEHASEPVPGRGSCMVYEDRPAVCRLYHAEGPDACRPPRKGSVRELDTHVAHQKLVNMLRLRSAGILGVELWREFRIVGVS